MNPVTPKCSTELLRKSDEKGFLNERCDAVDGIHHLTAISARPRDNLAFYTGLLGMRLVKKTVNQDDVSAYHLFYADGKANPGTDLTFFDSRPPRSSVGATAFRAPHCASPAKRVWPTGAIASKKPAATPAMSRRSTAG